MSSCFISDGHSDFRDPELPLSGCFDRFNYKKAMDRKSKDLPETHPISGRTFRGHDPNQPKVLTPTLRTFLSLIPKEIKRQNSLCPVSRRKSTLVSRQLGRVPQTTVRVFAVILADPITGKPTNTTDGNN